MSPHWKALQEDIQLEFSTNASAAEEVTVLRNPPLMAQLKELFKREMRISIRDRSLALYHYGGALIAGLLLGFTYFQMPLDLSGVISRIGLFFVVQCILGMQALQGLMAWRDCYTSFVRERAAGYYSTGAFVVTKVTVDALLLRVGPPLLLCLAIYSLAGLHPGRAGVSCLGVCLASIASSTFCFALGATAPRSAVVLPLAVLLLLIYLLFGGVLLSGATAVAYISFFRFSYDMLVSNEFRGLNFKFNPEGVSTTLASIPGEEWMRLLGIAGEPLGVQVGWLLGWSLIYVLLTWAILSIHTAGLQNPCGTAPKDRSHDESLQVGATESE